MKKPFTDLNIQLTDTAVPEFRNIILEEIKAFNDQESPAHREIRGVGKQPLDISVRDTEGNLVGGLMADTYWGWLEVDNLWLREDMRRGGLGSDLLARAEKEARRRGCRRALLSTFSFQAREFYEKNGYRVTGQLDDFPPGTIFYWLVKEL